MKIFVTWVFISILSLFLLQILSGVSSVDAATPLLQVNFIGINNTDQSGGWTDPIYANTQNVIQFRADITNIVDGTVAQNVRVKVDLPPAGSSTQIATVHVRSDNTPPVDETATVVVKTVKAS